MQERAIVLKRDSRGRVRTPIEQQLAVVAEFKRSGLPGTQFAKLVGMKYPTLMAWAGRKRCGQPAKRRGNRARFVEAVVAGPQVPGALLVDLGAGVQMKVADGTQVLLAAQLIQALKTPC